MGGAATARANATAMVSECFRAPYTLASGMLVVVVVVVVVVVIVVVVAVVGVGVGWVNPMYIYTYVHIWEVVTLGEPEANATATVRECFHAQYALTSGILVVVVAV